MNQPPIHEEAEKLALEILELSRNTLLVNLRFLKPALCQFHFQPNPETTLATDGFYLYYSFLHVLKSYRIQKELVIRDYLHTVLHCLYHHPFVDSLIDQSAWDLACDIAVEATISELHLEHTACSRSQRQQAVLSDLKAHLSLITAEKVYHYYREQQLSPETLATIRDLFLADDHSLWYQLSQNQQDANTSQTDGDSNSQDSDSSQGQQKENSGDQQADSDTPDASSSASDDLDKQNENDPRPQPDRDEQKKMWKEISARVQTDLETLSRQWAEKAGSLTHNLKACSRNRQDYGAFLRNFAVPGEEIRMNDEEFDYIYYTYGLKLYSNMPLVEPLEYKEVTKIRDFVIAIDTSASVQGDLVECFIRKTYEILKQEESFFQKIRLHIIQCDAAIQSDILITCEDELDTYLDSMTLKGFGGTDFRPVFQYIEKLQHQGELSGLKGILYFTDGDGVYPARQPNYKTAFIFVNREYDYVSVPVWAIKVQLSEQEIRAPISSPPHQNHNYRI